MIQLADLIVTQEELRKRTQISEMVTFVRKGGFFTQERLNQFSFGEKTPPLIQLTLFPDDRLIVHDGHHRLVSIYLAGREYISEEEYKIRKFTYEQYLEVNFDAGWVTPFHPLNEVRVCDWMPFKKALRLRRIFHQMPEDALERFIRSNRDMYCKARGKILTVADLANCVALGHCVISE